MKSAGLHKFITAVIFCVALILGPAAEAGSFLARGGDPAPVERQLGLFEHALNWLTGVWTDLTSGFATAAAESTISPQSPTCTDSDSDSGWGLDPEGCPRP